jgi:hypothetical protein
MTHSQLDVMLAESQVAVDETNELRDLLAPLTDVATEAPEPSADLEVLFHEGLGAAVDRARVLPLGRRRRARAAVAGAAVLALSGVGATGLSAAANTLPSPLQHQVSQFSQNFLPFNLPEPEPRHSRHAPDAAQAPKSGSLSRNQVESRDAGEPATTRSLGRPRRAIKGAPAWNDHDSGHGGSAADKPRAGESTYSKPRASGPGDEPRPPASESEIHASAGPETTTQHEGKNGWAKDEEHGSDESPGNAPGKNKNNGKHHDPSKGEHKGGSKDTDKQPGHGEPRGADQGSTGKHKPGDESDDHSDGGDHDAGSQGAPGDQESGSDSGEAGSRVTGVVGALLEGHAGA